MTWEYNVRFEFEKPLIFTLLNHSNDWIYILRWHGSDFARLACESGHPKIVHDRKHAAEIQLIWQLQK